MAYSTIVYYVVAHHEDRASFSAQQINADLANPQTKVVLIEVMANNESDPDHWWEAIVQCGACAARIALPNQPMTTYITQIQGHSIVVNESGNRVTYCLRLPGRNSTCGGEVERGDSLATLRVWTPTHPGEQPCPLRAIDGSTEYKSWSDFCTTLAGILSTERQGICQLHPWINALDYSTQHDDADSTAVGDALRCFARRCFYNRMWWHAASPTDFYADSQAPGGQASRRLVPWYQFDFDLVKESHSHP